jgi:hypothetical protein
MSLLDEKTGLTDYIQDSCRISSSPKKQQQRRIEPTLKPKA